MNATSEQFNQASEIIEEANKQIADIRFQISELDNERKLREREKAIEEERKKDKKVEDPEDMLPMTKVSEDVLTQLINTEFNLLNDANIRRNYMEKRASDARIELAEIEAEKRIAMLQAVANGFAAFSQLAGQQTGVGKALAVASASINTYLAMAEALVGPATPLKIAQAVSIGAFGLAQVKDILSVQVPDSTLRSPLITGSGGSGASTPAIQQPSFNIVGDPGINQLQDTIRSQTNEPVRAYVVSDDVRTQDELDRNIRASASL